MLLQMIETLFAQIGLISCGHELFASVIALFLWRSWKHESPKSSVDCLRGIPLHKNMIIHVLSIACLQHLFLCKTLIRARMAS